MNNFGKFIYLIITYRCLFIYPVHGLFTAFKRITGILLYSSRMGKVLCFINVNLIFLLTYHYILFL